MCNLVYLHVSTCTFKSLVDKLMVVVSLGQAGGTCGHENVHRFPCACPEGIEPFPLSQIGSMVAPRPIGQQPALVRGLH